MRSHMSRVLVSTFAAAILGAQASAATYIVDRAHADARDSNPGTRELPLKTIGAAAKLVEAGDTVTIRPGVYREKVGIKKTGTKERPIVFQAERKGAVVITGADVMTGWRQEEIGLPIYSVRWTHNFAVNTRKDGTLVRNHGADAPVGCAEQVIWDGRPLAHVLKLGDMKQGTFHVDWGADKLYVWLPGGVDANATEVLASTRADQFVRGGHWGHWFPAEHIHIKGIVFRYAANFAQRGGVKPYNGWRLEDCVVEWNNAGGIGAEGSDITIVRTICQDNGFCGLGGCKGRNILVKDCISRRNNTKGFPVGWDGGGGKWLHTDGLRFVNHTAYQNVGPGIWLDWSNKNYTIENCVCYANIGNRHDWEGMGIFTEANDGPGVITGCTVYSNTGAGIGIAESQHLTVEYNTLCDNGESIQFRAMEGRAHHKLENVKVVNNTFKGWRHQAIGTSLGTWNRGSAAAKRLTVDDNTYDGREGATLLKWARDRFTSLDAARDALAVEVSGRERSATFTRRLVATRTRSAMSKRDVDEAVAGARVGDTVVIPANGRTSLARSGGAWSCQLFDLSNRFISVTVSSRMKSRIEGAIAPYPVTEPVLVKVRLSRTGEDLAGDVVDFGTHLASAR